MSQFAFMAQQGQLFDADHDHEQHVEQQYAETHQALYERDSEVQGVLDGAMPGASRGSSPGPRDIQHHAAAQTPDPSQHGQPPSEGGAEVGAGAPAPAAAAGRPNLEHSSAVSATDTRSLGSSAETEDAVQITRPEDDQPLRRFVMRASSFTKEDFERLLQNQGLFSVGNSLAADMRLAKSHLPPSKLEPPAERRAGRRHRQRHYSILRLPMARPDTIWVMVWSTIVLFSDLTYSAFIVPISIGMWTSFYTANWTTIADIFFGAVFLADIIISLHVGFIATYNTRKLLVMNGRLVARNYLTSFGFFVDACATTAWVAQIVMIILYNTIETFDPRTALIVMEGVRLLRFVRVLRLLSGLLSSGIYASLMLEVPYFKWLRSQSFVSLCYLMYLIAVVVNFLGCLWNFVAGAEDWNNSWVNYYPPFVRRYAVEPFSSQLTHEEALEVNRPWLWLVGNYWALTTVATVGYGDVVPANAAESVVAMCVEIIGVMFFGLVISSISELLQQANRQARRMQVFRAKIQAVERWMKAQGLPSRLQRRIKTFYAEVWIRQHEVREETVLFQELPHALRNEVAWQACRRKFRQIPLMRELDDKTLYLLASKMVPFRFGPGHDLATEGDPADRFWLLAEGEVVALYQYREAERLEGPAVVGEAALLQEHEEALRTYPCTYRTLTGCSCWMVRCRDFKPMLRPALEQLVKARALQSLAERMRRFPEAWEGRELRRLGTKGEPSAHRALSTTHSSFSALLGDGDGVGPESPPRGGVTGAATSRSRLAHSSGPLPPLHRKSISWGGEHHPPGAEGGREAAAERQAGGIARSSQVSWRGAAAAAAQATDSDADSPAVSSQQQQQEAAVAQSALTAGFVAPAAGPAGRSRPGVLAPLTEGQLVHTGLDPPAATAAPGDAATPGAAGAAALQHGQRQQAEDGDFEVEPLLDVMVVAEHSPEGRGAHPAAAAGRALAHTSAAVAGRGLAAIASAAVAARRLRVSPGGHARTAAEEEAEAAELAAELAAVQLNEAERQLPTNQALALLDHAAEEKEHEKEVAAAHAAHVAQAALSEGGSGEGATRLLAAVLAELQGLRQDVDALNQRHTSAGAS